MPQILVSFSRLLTSELNDCWNSIISESKSMVLFKDHDKVSWKLEEKKGKCIVKSTYNALITINDSGPYFKKIWKG